MLSRQTAISRDAEGRWFEGGSPIDQPAIERAFDRWIDLAEDGRFCLRNSVNWAYVEIEGAPIFVRRAFLDHEGALLVLSDETNERLEPRTLRQGPEGALYCDVRGGRLAARFDRSAVFALAEALGEDEAGVYVELGGVRVRPPSVDDPLNSAGPGATAGPLRPAVPRRAP
jgi:hypothetical protein